MQSLLNTLIKWHDKEQKIPSNLSSDCKLDGANKTTQKRNWQRSRVCSDTDAVSQGHAAAFNEASDLLGRGPSPAAAAPNSPICVGLLQSLFMGNVCFKSYILKFSVPQPPFVSTIFRARFLTRCQYGKSSIGVVHRAT